MPRFPSDTAAIVRATIPVAWQRWTLVTGVWLLIATLSATVWWIFPPGDYPYSWFQLHRAKILLWLAWGGVTPMILWFGYRFRIERPYLAKRVTILLALSALVTCFYLILYTSLLLLNLLGKPHGITFLKMLKFVITTHATFYWLAYWATIGVEHALGYYKKYHERAMRASQLQGELAEARLDALKSQVQPHFLFNTLNSIGILIRKQEGDKAVQTINRLSELLRYSLNHINKSRVTVQEELDFANSYLAIEQLRFGDRLQVQYNIANEARNALVPSFLLQPLVENAIKHAVERVSEDGLIKITIRSNETRLYFMIEDNGPGISKPSERSRQGIGLDTLQSRLRTRYGDQCSVRLISESGSGTRVEIEMPFEQETDFTGKRRARV